MPAKVELADADAAGVDAGQRDGAPIQRLQEGNLPHQHLQTLDRPTPWGAPRRAAAHVKQSLQSAVTDKKCVNIVRTIAVEGRIKEL